MESKQELKKGPWKPEEDLLLTRYIEVHGEGKWATVSKRSGHHPPIQVINFVDRKIGLSANVIRVTNSNLYCSSCRLDERRKELQTQVEELSPAKSKTWSLIAGRLPGRTDNEVKNYWNTHLSKKYTQGQADTDKSNLKKRKQSHSYDTTQPSCRKRPHIVTSCNGLEGSFAPNVINELDDGSDDLQITVPDHSCMDDFKSFHYEQSQLLPRKFYDDPFLPSIDSTFSLDPFGHGTKYWTDLPIYSPESIYQILL
ncbi:hypothetical protein Sjap_019291 [Stephania japonica]|uniref:Uncharacterized protein n=1 Tax=Stephania japonica TaxID=461633 RepID=A0AAP0F1B0_9MAGN